MEHVGGNVCPSFRLSNWTTKNIETKDVVALVGRQTTNGHNNQPKTHGRDQGGAGEEVRPGESTGGGLDPIVLAAIEVNMMEYDKINHWVNKNDISPSIYLIE